MSKKLLFSLVVVLAAVCAVGIGQPRAQMSLAPGGVGDVLLGSLYDVRIFADNPDLPERQGLGTWENFIEIQNTTNQWVAAHLRFRTFRKSIEVYDRIILLSPYDVFWMYMTKPEGQAGVRIASSDWETLGNSGFVTQADAAAGQWVTNNGTGVTYEWSANFSTELLAQNGFPTDDAELEYGEFEVMGVWAVDNPSHSIATIQKNTYADPNDPSSINVYDILFSAWGSAGNSARSAAPLATSVGDGGGYPLVDCGNVLKGSIEMGDTVSGQYTAYNLTGIQDFRTTLASSAFHRDGYATGVMLYPVNSLLVGTQRCYGAAGEVAYYLNEDWATTAGPTLRDGDSSVSYAGAVGVADFNDPWSLFDVETALYKEEAWTFYMTGDTFDNGMPLRTEINLTFPTKYLHYFVTEPVADPDFPAMPFYTVGTISCGSYIGDVMDFRAGIFASWEAYNNGPIGTDGAIYNTDQETFGFSPGPSPYSGLGPYVPHEVNLIHVGEAGTIFDIPAASVDNFMMGQISLTNWELLEPEFMLLDYVNDRQLPVLGVATRIHNVGGTAVYRSVSVPLAWKAGTPPTPPGLLQQ